MQKHSLLKFALVIALAVPLNLGFAASVKRIQSAALDKGQVHRLYLSPGLASVITFPCDVDEAVVGREQDLKVQVSPTTKRQLTLHLSNWSALHTNLLVRCGDKRDPFVFDIIVSRTTHQDHFKVSSFFGSPEDESLQTSVIDSSEKNLGSKTGGRKRIIEIKQPILVEGSK